MGMTTWLGSGDETQAEMKLLEGVLKEEACPLLSFPLLDADTRLGVIY